MFLFRTDTWMDFIPSFCLGFIPMEINTFSIFSNGYLFLSERKKCIWGNVFLINIFAYCSLCLYEILLTS